MRLKITIRVYSADPQPTEFEAEIKEGQIIKVCNGVHIEAVRLTPNPPEREELLDMLKRLNKDRSGRLDEEVLAVIAKAEGRE